MYKFIRILALAAAAVAFANGAQARDPQGVPCKRNAPTGATVYVRSLDASSGTALVDLVTGGVGHFLYADVQGTYRDGHLKFETNGYHYDVVVRKDSLFGDAFREATGQGFRVTKQEVWNCKGSLLPLNQAQR